MNESIPAREIKLDFRISVLKSLHVVWIMKFYNYIRSKLDIILNGWDKSIIAKVKTF